MTSNNSKKIKHSDNNLITTIFSQSYPKWSFLLVGISMIIYYPNSWQKFIGALILFLYQILNDCSPKAC